MDPFVGVEDGKLIVWLTEGSTPEKFCFTPEDHDRLKQYFLGAKVSTVMCAASCNVPEEYGAAGVDGPYVRTFIAEALSALSA